jgi:hypothetical protein
MILCFSYTVSMKKKVQIKFRKDWGIVIPITRKIESKKLYNRRKEKLYLN